MGRRQTIFPSEIRTPYVRFSSTEKTTWSPATKRRRGSGRCPAPARPARRSSRGALAASVEAADEHEPVRDRGRRSRALRPARSEQAPVARVEGDDLAGARDAVDPGAVGRRARVEALVPERVPAHVRRPEPRAGPPVQAEDRARVRGDADAGAVDGRARVDAASRRICPANAAGRRVDRVHASVRDTEVDEAVDDDGRRLHLARRRHAPTAGRARGRVP